MIDVEEGAGVELTAEMIRAQLDLMVRDEVFRSSKRSIAFRRYVVEQTLNGSADQIKERTIGVEVFSRKPSYLGSVPTTDYGAPRVRWQSEFLIEVFSTRVCPSHPTSFEHPVPTRHSLLR
jgi:hypothetical protein